MNIPQAANAGVIRPPVVYLVTIAAGLALEQAWPLVFLPPELGVTLGAGFIAIAVGVFFFSVRTFREAGTAVPGNKPTSTIVRTGPYRFSRNPIYLAFSLLQFGVASWIDSLWVVATLLAAIAVMAWFVIPREERYLESRFGAEYLDYKACVRRWL